MRDEANADDALDVTLLQARPHELPELAAIVTAHPDIPEDLGQHGQAALDIGPGDPLRAVRRRQPVGVGDAILVLETLEQFFGCVGTRHGVTPHPHHLIVRQVEIDIGITAVVIQQQTVFLLQPIPQRRARQRLQQIDGQHRDLRLLDELEDGFAGIRLVGIEAEDDAGHHLHAVFVELLDALQNRHHHVVGFRHRLERIAIRRLDAAEHRGEVGVAHLREDFRTLGDVERRLAGELQGEAVALLPFDQVRQQLEHGTAVADEIVVDEIDRAQQPACQQLVELGGDLLRRLQAGVATIQRRDIAELALIGAAAGKLDAADKVFGQRNQLVGRLRELGHVATIERGQHHLLRRT